jgi:hypothetical protein
MSLADAIRRRIPERWIRSWPTLRAVLVGYHVLAVLVLSFPAPPSNMRREAWDNPTVQREFQLWWPDGARWEVHLARGADAGEAAVSRLRRWWTAWVLLLGRREPGDTIALFRIAAGAVTLWSLLAVATSGLIDVLWVDKAWGGYRSLGDGPYLIQWLGGPTPPVIHLVMIVTLSSSALLVLGLGGRLAAFITLQGYLALSRLDSNASGSSDLLVTNALWLLVLARSTATLSLDCKLRTGRFRSDEEISAFPRYLAVLQIVVMYWATGTQKLSMAWFPAGSYSALYYILQEPSWQRFSMTWAARVYPLTQVATAVTWIWEVTAPLLLLVYYLRYTEERGGRLRAFMNRCDLRKPWALLGALLHGMILITMDVGHFSQIALAFYICLWQPAELRAAGAWVIARARRRPPDALAS